MIMDQGSLMLMKLSYIWKTSCIGYTWNLPTLRVTLDSSSVWDQLESIRNRRMTMNSYADEDLGCLWRKRRENETIKRLSSVAGLFLTHIWMHSNTNTLGSLCRRRLLSPHRFVEVFSPLFLLLCSLFCTYPLLLPSSLLSLPPLRTCHSSALVAFGLQRT